MPKTQIKRETRARQNGLCALTGEILPDEPSHYDTDRRQPKARGGTYTKENTRVVDPVAHFMRHGNWRDRPAVLKVLKSCFDDRIQMMKLLFKVQNQLLAFTDRHVDDPHPDTVEFLNEQITDIKKRFAEVDKTVAQIVKRYDDPLAQATLSVPGIGPITTAALAVYVDFEKVICSACMRTPEDCQEREPHERKETGCEGGPVAVRLALSTPSSLWAYVGLDKSSHERYQKGRKGGGNIVLRTALWNTANSLMKDRDNPYRLIYDRTKERLSFSQKIVKTRNTQGHLVECAWRDAKPSHRHGAGLRAIMKHLLVDYWLTGRRLKGMPTVTPYAHAMLGHSHLSMPWERGWPKP